MEITNNRGISHIEDLKIHEFLEIFSNIDDYEISEKVDGSNIQFGIDTQGFYTTRENFGGSRVYDVNSYPVHFPTTFLRSAHSALVQIMPALIIAGLQEGDRFEAEVLFGELPNAVPYSSVTNQIILLRSMTGDTDVDSLRNALQGEVVVVDLPSPYTLDGKNVCVAAEQQQWLFSSTTVYDMSGDLRDAILAEIANINVHDEDSVTETKATVKELLLNRMVRHSKSEFGPELVNGGWIEGVVLRHKHNKRQYKVVDKRIFGTVKNFVWDVRNQLSKAPRSVSNVESFIGHFLKGLSESVNHPLLCTTQAKRYLKKLGNTPEEITKNLAKDVILEEVQQVWLEFIELQQVALTQRLEHYHATRSEKAITVNLGNRTQIFTYNNEIDKRTLQVFSSLFLKLEYFKQGAVNATSSEDLIMLLIEGKL